jgi:hypothetical protein
MELQLVHERLSLMNLRRDIGLASVRGIFRSILHMLTVSLRMWSGARSLRRNWERSRRDVADCLRQAAKANELPGAKDQRAETIGSLREIATRLRGSIDSLNELISQTRKFRNYLRYRRHPLLSWLTNRRLRLYIRIHDGLIFQQRDLVILLSELDPPTKDYPSVPDLMKSMAKAV